MEYRQPERRQFGIVVSEQAFNAVHRRAKDLGMPGTTYAKLLFEAGFTARIGQEKRSPVDDAELDAAVRAVFCLAGVADPSQIARVTGFSETLVVNVLAGFRHVAGGKKPDSAPKSTVPQVPQGKPGWTDGLVAKAAAMWSDGQSTAAIAAAVGRTENAVEQYAYNHRSRVPVRREA